MLTIFHEGVGDLAKRDARYFDVYRHVVARPGDELTRELLFENAGGFEVAKLSADGSHVALVVNRTNVDSDVYLWSADWAEPLHVTPHDGNANHEPRAPQRRDEALPHRVDLGGARLGETSDAGHEITNQSGSPGPASAPCTRNCACHRLWNGCDSSSSCFR